MLRHRSPEWYAARRKLITATDLPVILGLSPYKSESTLAQEKLGELPEQDETLMMEIGRLIEPAIAREYERVSGAEVARFRGLVTHPRIEWAGASPDARRKRLRYLVEFKDTRSRRWPAEGGVPQDVEAQVRWQMGVTGFPIADVAALKWGTLEVTTLEHDQHLFEQLVTIADDFRSRLAAGGPFAEDAASIRTRYPADDGSELEADAEINELVQQLLSWRAQLKEGELWADGVETQIKQRMATAQRMTGDGWAISWKKSKDSEVIDWQAVARAYRLLLEAQVQRVNLPDWMVKLSSRGNPAQLEPGLLDAIEGVHTGLKPGGRPFRLTPSRKAEQER